MCEFCEFTKVNLYNILLSNVGITIKTFWYIYKHYKLPFIYEISDFV